MTITIKKWDLTIKVTEDGGKVQNGWPFVIGQLDNSYVTHLKDGYGFLPLNPFFSHVFLDIVIHKTNQKHFLKLKQNLDEYFYRNCFVHRGKCWKHAGSLELGFCSSVMAEGAGLDLLGFWTSGSGHQAAAHLTDGNNDGWDITEDFNFHTGVIPHPTK